MPKNNNDFSSSYFNHLIDNDVRSHVSTSKLTLHDFMTSPAYANWKLYPVQEVIVKILSGVELDNKNKIVKIYDYLLEDCLYDFTETEFVKYAYDEGRIGFKEQPDHIGVRWLMALGRRSFKSALAGAVHSFQFLKYMNVEDPWEYYNMRPSTKVLSGIFSTSLPQANIIFDEVISSFNSIDTFKSWNPDVKVKGIYVKHPKHVRYLKKKAKPHYVIKPFAANAKTGLGFSLFCLTVDEIGNFIAEQGGMSAEELIRKLSPTLSTFGDDAFWMAMSNATSDTDCYWSQLCDKAMDNPGDPYQIFRFPSWWVNLNPKYVPERRKAFKSDPASFWVEYGSNFGVGGQRWLASSIINLSEKPSNIIPKPYYFCGLDLAFTGDSCSGTVLAPSNDSMLVEIEHATLKAGEGDYKDKKIVPPRDFVAILEGWHRKYNLKMIITDQHEIMGLISMLSYPVLSVLRDIHFTQILNDVEYKFLYDWLLREAFILKNPILLESLRGLVEIKRRGKVHVTAASGKRDDPADSLARALLAFIMYCRKNPGFSRILNYDLDQFGSYGTFSNVLTQRLINTAGKNYQESKTDRYLAGMSSSEKFMGSGVSGGGPRTSHSGKFGSFTRGNMRDRYFSGNPRKPI